MTTLLAYRSNRIVELMAEPAEGRGADWLKDALQQALMLELATLPPYLCGLWSIKDPSADGVAAEAIRRVVFDEMSHLGLACNLLTTIGGVPRLADERTVPKYPGPLPGGVRPELSVFLSGLTKESLDLYARIEEPDAPVADAEGATHTSIGSFYTAVLAVFRQHEGLITGARQLKRRMAHHGTGNSIEPLTSLAAVEKAIGIIKEQGEGTSGSPANPHPGEDGELAHYYVFRELFLGRKLIRTSETPETWAFAGEDISMPAALPMATVPLGGWEAAGPLDADTRRLLGDVNRAYSQMLRFLESAWQTDFPAEADDLLTEAVGQMFELEGPARMLMERQLPDGSGRTYGPEFRYTDA
ncbi:ferritin-like protein [Streptomyces sp. NPDC059949]|uniref:ferritin-like domain-containing protein n=1 Tax=Streptomyces sp. NPDC059949 TaxID=3347013 RepID=UPI0036516A5F